MEANKKSSSKNEEKSRCFSDKIEINWDFGGEVYNEKCPTAQQKRKKGAECFGDAP